MKSVPDLINTTLVFGGNALLRVFDRSPTMPDNDFRRRELESVSGLYGDDLLQTIDVYAIQSYRVLNEEIEKVWQDIHHEVATIHPMLRHRLQALSSSVGHLNERVHSHSVAALKLQQSVEESYIGFDSLPELSDKLFQIESRIEQKEVEQKQARAAIKTGFNNLLNSITQVPDSQDNVQDNSQDNSQQKSQQTKATKQKLFEEKLSKLELLDLVYERLQLSYLKSVQAIRTADKTLVDIRLDFEEQKALPRTFSKWTLEKLEEQKHHLTPKILELRKQLKTLKDNYAETDRRGSMYRLEQESIEKELTKFGDMLTSTDHELELHRIEAALEGKQKQFSTLVISLRKHSQEIDQKLVQAIHAIAEMIVELYGKQQKVQTQDTADYLFPSVVSIEDLPKLGSAFALLQKLEGLRLRNQQHFLRMDIWLSERKIKKLSKDFKEHKKLGANKGSFGAAIKEIEQEIEKRRVQTHDGLHSIFKTHLELLLDRHKQPKECLATSQFAFEKACVTKAISFESFMTGIKAIVSNKGFEKEQTPQDLVRRKAILSCIRTKNSVIHASKVMKSKHAEVLLVASETPNLLHASDNLMKRRKKVHDCKKKLREIENDISQLLNG